MTTRWLTPEEQRAWRAYIAAVALVEDALDRQLQQEAGMPHLYYSILATLSDAPAPVEGDRLQRWFGEGPGPGAGIDWRKAMAPPAP